MALNLSNFLISKKDKSKMADFQDLDHLDGVSISVTSANLYNNNRDDLVLFYFRNGAEYASVYTKSKVISENIKWNLSIKSKRIRALIVNARNANCLTGSKGFNSLREIAEEAAKLLSNKQKSDEDNPKKISPKDIIFGCTGTIGETFPLAKIKSSIKNLVDKIKYTQNKYLWIKSAMSILTTDLKPKLAMEECKIGNTKVKIYGIAKGSGMISPNLATMLSFIFTDADIPNNVIQTVGYMSDYEKLTQAKELLVDVGKYNKGRYKRISEPYNQGFKQNPTQYIVIFWERV